MLISILCYHKINKIYRNVDCIKTNNFINHIKVIKENGYQSVFLDDIVTGDLPKKPVCITFDDCYESFFKFAYPVLKKYKIKATNFIPTDYIGDDVRHSSREWEMDKIERRKPVMHCLWSEITEMKENGIRFESHGKSHGLLTLIDNDKLKSEIVDSRIIIEKRLGTRVNFFSYPWTRSNKNIVDMLIENGYQGAVGMNNKKHVIGGDIFNINRIQMTMHTNMERLLNG